MNQISALGPPRTGKKVLTKEEFFEEMKNWQKIEPTILETPNQATTTTPDPTQTVIPTRAGSQSYFQKLGRFNLGSITKKGQDYVFHDLELPMGYWTELTLYSQLLPGDPRTFDAWAEVTKNNQPTGVTPADIRYALMTVCYLNKNKPQLKPIIQEIHSSILTPDAKTHYPHNSTKIEYRAKAPAIITPGNGWPINHPFSAQYEANISGLNSEISNATALQDPTIQSALEDILGENDPNRCKQVIEWAMNTKPAKLWRCNQDHTGHRVLVFGVYVGYANIGANDGDLNHRPARAVNADAKNFHTK